MNTIYCPMSQIIHDKLTFPIGECSALFQPPVWTSFFLAMALPFPRISWQVPFYACVVNSQNSHHLRWLPFSSFSGSFCGGEGVFFRGGSGESFLPTF